MRIRPRRLLFWISQAILISAALLGTLVNWRQLFPRPQPLVAEFNTVPFALPQGLVTGLYRAVSLEPEDLKTALRDIPDSQRLYDLVMLVRTPLVLKLKSTLSDQLDFGQKFHFRTITLVKVRNSGNQKLEDVRLQLQILGEDYVRIARPGQEPVFKLTKGVVEIGTLGPREYVEVIGWGVLGPHWWPDGTEPLTHSRGVGQIVTWGPPKSALDQLREAYAPRWSTVALILLAALIAVQFLKTRRGRAREIARPDDKPEAKP